MKSGCGSRGSWILTIFLTEALGLLYLASEPVRKFCRRFRYLLVDEFQDISPLQYQLILAWNREGDELFVIGDPDQSIYGFRGSDPECFARLMEDFPETEVIRLRENLPGPRRGSQPPPAA